VPRKVTLTKFVRPLARDGGFVGPEKAALRFRLERHYGCAPNSRAISAPKIAANVPVTPSIA
jgi:hypothetical protein